MPPFTPYWNARFLPVAWQKLLQAIEYRPLRSWFYFILQYQAWAHSTGWGPFGNYYEFGTGEGLSLAQYADALRTFCRHTGMPPNRFRIVGFDTFQGLPPTENYRDAHPGLPPGRFAGSTSEIMELLRRKRVITQGVDVRLVEGRFEKSLTPQLLEPLRAYPPSLVNIDVDYYSATSVVLNWLRPLLSSGTIFHFDDLWLFHANPAYGELAAIREFNARGEGALEPFPLFASPAIAGHAFMFHRPEFEWKRDEKAPPPPV
ncbi:MAG: class I SAM-dependent methyltransferase [Thermoplasmata archaeon]|nr:class I SAM-dependent methyltransferase [Thermoplasmata archaeon]